MKKILFFLVAVCAMCVISCSKKQANTTVKLFDEFSLVGRVDATDTVRYGLSSSTAGTLVYPEYDTIVWNKALDGFICTKNGKMKIADKAGNFAGSAEYDSISREGKFYRLVNEDGVTYYNTTDKEDTWGPFDNIVIREPYVFICDEGLWGVYTMRHKAILQRNYDNIYVVIVKSDTAVVSCSGGEWNLNTLDGARYDVPSAQLQKKVKAAAPAGSIGILEKF